MLHGAIAAALTPLEGDGASPDEAAVAPYVDFLASHGVDGVLALGTTGEGMLFDLDERRRIAERFIDAGRDRLQVAVHCGAQTTADTVALAEHAAMYGADAGLVSEPTPERGARVAALRASLQALPFHAASKTALALRGVPIRPDVRRPLRGLRDDERHEVERIVREWAG